jgi:hypothetical protein
VIPARRRLDHRGFAVGEQAGEEQARLDLRARDLEPVLGAGERRAPDPQRR